jgi:hypothetical protein
MNEILDEDEILEGKEVIDKRVKNPSKIAIIDLVLMFSLNCIFAYLDLRYLDYTIENPSINLCLFDATMFTMIFLFLSFILESGRFILRELRTNKGKKDAILLNPFWLQVIEGAWGMTIIGFVFFLFFYFSHRIF